MKVTDIMINDWVLVDGEPTKVTSELIYQIDKDKNGKHELVPIPLDEEILIENGFESEEGAEDRYILHTDYVDEFENTYSVIVDNGQGITDMFVSLNYEETSDFDYKFPDFSYVHEFQHALRTSYYLKDLADDIEINSFKKWLKDNKEGYDRVVQIEKNITYLKTHKAEW